MREPDLNPFDLAEGERVKATLRADHHARSFTVGDKVRTLFAGSGDVTDDDGKDYEATFPIGALATVTGIERLKAPQGVAITVHVFDEASNDFIVNVLDEADDEFTATGRYPIELLEAPAAKPAPSTLAVIDAAIADLRRVRTSLREAGAPKAADYVQRALKSVEGARRHAERMQNEGAR
jgi:hypothetical protein